MPIQQDNSTDMFAMLSNIATTYESQLSCGHNQTYVLRATKQGEEFEIYLLFHYIVDTQPECRYVVRGPGLQVSLTEQVISFEFFESNHGRRRSQPQSTVMHLLYAIVYICAVHGLLITSIQVKGDSREVVGDLTERLNEAISARHDFLTAPLMRSGYMRT